MIAVILAAAILLAYVASLWWLLRRESVEVLLVVLVLCALSLSVRLVYTRDFPTGLNEDEVKSLSEGIRALRSGELWGASVEGPVLLNAVFQASLVPLLGPNRWAIRTYSLIASVLAAAAAFAAGRALKLRVAPSLAIGAFIAVLPWSLLYGRISLGGEMTFHQLLLLAAAARVIWADNAGLGELGIGGLGLCLLLYDYTAGWAMLAMPGIAAVLARGRRRALSIAVLILAVLLWLPYLLNAVDYWLPAITGKLTPGIASHTGGTLWSKGVSNFRALVSPAARDGWLAIRCAAMHPLLILVLAVIGAFTGVRRGLFLWAGFVAALLPSILSEGALPSSHRMLMMFPFIAIAAGCALDLLCWRLIRRAAAVIVVAIVALQSIRLYFSPAFWPVESQWIFDWERTAVVEALPPAPHPRFVLGANLTNYFAPRGLSDRDYEFLTVENWFPPDHDAAVYAFEQHDLDLRSFYEDLFGVRRVKVFGRAFLVTLEKGDWSWVKQHGWAYEARCGNRIWKGQVPVLFHTYVTFSDMWCPDPVLHTWNGHWDGPASRMRLGFSGAAEVQAGDRLVKKEGTETSMEFNVEPGADVRVTVTSSTPAPVVGFFEITPAGDRVPLWERVRPNWSAP